MLALLWGIALGAAVLEGKMVEAFIFNTYFTVYILLVIVVAETACLARSMDRNMH
jgi:hypothetical protein